MRSHSRAKHHPVDDDAAGRYERLSRNELIERIQRLEQLVEARSTDGLTGAWNRAAIKDALCAEGERAKRTGHPVSIVLADVNGLKAINDRHGHAAGDAILIRFVKIARAAIRRYDSIGRWGGDEFLIILPALDIAGARRVAARVADRLGRGEGSASFGVAQVDNRGPEEAIRRADAALYASKGANRVSSNKRTSTAAAD